jgi:hypothetical protein
MGPLLCGRSSFGVLRMRMLRELRWIVFRSPSDQSTIGFRYQWQLSTDPPPPRPPQWPFTPLRAALLGCCSWSLCANVRDVSLLRSIICSHDMLVGWLVVATPGPHRLTQGAPSCPCSSRTVTMMPRTLCGCGWARNTNLTQSRAHLGRACAASEPGNAATVSPLSDTEGQCAPLHGAPIATPYYSLLLEQTTGALVEVKYLYVSAASDTCSAHPVERSCRDAWGRIAASRTIITPPHGHSH